MKKIITILLFATLCINGKAQCNQPYRAFNTFANDTTAFLRYNFKIRADCYKGKSVTKVLADLQLNPKSLIILSSTYTNKYEGIRIFIDNNKWSDSSTKKAQSIYIYWPEPLDYTEALKLKRTYNSDVWIQKHYDFFKNLAVGEVAYYR